MPFDGRDYQPNKDIDAAIEMLRAARMKLCLPDLWCQKVPWRDGRLCLGMALAFSTSDDIMITRMVERTVLAAANKLFPRCSGYQYLSIPSFNDVPTTTFERLHQVIDLAEETLKAERK